MENNEEQVKLEKKKSKTLLLVIGLLIVIVLGLGGFIFANKDKILGNGSTDKNTTSASSEKEKETKEPTTNAQTNENETSDKEVTFTNDELQKYVDYINPVSIGPSAKLYKVDKIVASELSAREKIEYIGRTVYKTRTTSANFEYDIIAEADVKKLVEEIYGKNTYERTTFNLSCGDYKFHEDDSKFYAETGCGGITDTLSENLVIDYKATTSRLEITTAYAFADSDEKIYKDSDKQTIIDTFSNVGDIKTYLNNYVKENKDKLNHLVYVYESTDGEHYYFKEFRKQ